MQCRHKFKPQPVIAVWLFVFVFVCFFPTVAFGQSTLTGVILRDANLRAGPGTNYAIAGKVTAGQTVQIMGKSAAGDWYHLENETWIAAFLVKVGTATATPTPVLPNPGALTAIVSPTTTLTTTVTNRGGIPPTLTMTATAPKTLIRQLAKVISINSGDTIRVSLNGKEYKVRYLLISTPKADQPLYSEAMEANRQLLKDKLVYLVKDTSDTDHSGALLRYIYLQNGTFVNAELVRLGYALLTTFTSDLAKEPEILAAQQAAMSAGRGLWAAQLPTPAPVVANREGNVRACPNLKCATTGHVTAGQTLKVVARNVDKTWYQLADGGWVVSILVNNPPAALPIVTPKAASPALPKATPQPTKTH